MAFVLAGSYGQAQESTLQRWAGDAVGIEEPGRHFRWSVERCGPRLRSEWRDARGVLVAWDEVHQRGGSFSEYQLARAATAQRIHATQRTRSIDVATKAASGMQRTRSIATAGEAVLAGPMLVSLVQEQLPRLRSGESIERAYLVPEHSMVLRLVARRIQAGAGGGISVQIHAASPLLRPFVPTTVLEFDRSDRLVRSSGRILPLDGPALLTTHTHPEDGPGETCAF
jgi:hypothetical protein